MNIKHGFVEEIVGLQQELQRAFLCLGRVMHFDVFHPAFGRVDRIPRHILERLVTKLLDRTRAVLIRYELDDPAQSLIALVAHQVDLLSCGRRIAAAFFISDVDRAIVFPVQGLRIARLRSFVFDRPNGERKAQQESIVEATRAPMMS